MACELASVHFAHTMSASPRKPAWRRTFLREWREHCGLSLETVAAKVGMQHGQLSRIERGLQPYSQRVLEICAELYGCTVQDLLTRRPTEADNVFAMWSRLSDGQRRRAARVIDALRDDEDER